MGLRTLFRGLAIQALLSSCVTAAPSPKQAEVFYRAATCNTATNRACWTTGFDINTDYEASVPTTGVTRSYTLTVTEVNNWVGGDGHVKEIAMLINNQVPGPVITADWGDTLSITVVNKLKTNGTSFHWHGIRQLNSNIHDGVNGITECPIPPGGQKTYTFQATQYGTTWYHSHYSAQYGNGVVGAMVINGPASLPYDTDLGVMPIMDWYWAGADNLQSRINNPNNPLIPGAPGAPPPSDNVLWNGTAINYQGSGGSYATMTVTKGKRHRLRFVNLSVENTFTISIQNHSMTVIGVDFVPVNSFTTSSLYIGIGQRYDVTIDASQAVGNYWINATMSSTGACGLSNNPFPAMILSYSGAGSGLPTNTGVKPVEHYCEDLVDFVPIVTRTVPSWTPQPTQQVSITLDVDTANSAVFWKVNGSAMDIIWEQPTLEFILNKSTSFPVTENTISIPDGASWTYFALSNTIGVPHPIHLHGHDFMILGRSPAPTNPFAATPTAFTPSNDLAGLRLSNPTRRDVAMLPGSGWLVIAFKNDNPGAWLLHCHIAWHVSQGLSVQFLELQGQIPSAMNLAFVEDNCKAWRAYQPTDPFPKIGSGLKMMRKE